MKVKPIKASSVAKAANKAPHYVQKPVEVKSNGRNMLAGSLVALAAAAGLCLTRGRGKAPKKNLSAPSGKIILKHVSKDLKEEIKSLLREVVAISRVPREYLLEKSELERLYKKGENCTKLDTSHCSQGPAYILKKGNEILTFHYNYDDGLLGYVDRVYPEGRDKIIKISNFLNKKRVSNMGFVNVFNANNISIDEAVKFEPIEGFYVPHDLRFKHFSFINDFRGEGGLYIESKIFDKTCSKYLSATIDVNGEITEVSKEIYGLDHQCISEKIYNSNK
jgi:hypothetical protein